MLFNTNFVFIHANGMSIGAGTLTAGTTVTRAGWRKVLRFPPPQHCPFLLSVERPILLHIVPDVPVQVIRIITHISYLLQDRCHDGSFTIS